MSENAQVSRECDTPRDAMRVAREMRRAGVREVRIALLAGRYVVYGVKPNKPRRDNPAL